MFTASILEKGGRLSRSIAISSAISLPIISGLVDINCPNLINDGPNSLSADEILMPSAVPFFDLSRVIGASMKVNSLNKIL
jgi:hypothetical protein